MAEQTTFRQRVQRRKRILRWWERHCIQIVVFVIIAFGFMLGCFAGVFSLPRRRKPMSRSIPAWCRKPCL